MVQIIFTGLSELQSKQNTFKVNQDCENALPI